MVPKFILKHSLIIKWRC